MYVVTQWGPYQNKPCKAYLQCVTDQTNLTIRNKLFLLFVQRWLPVFRSGKDGSAVTHRIPQHLEENMVVLGSDASLNDPDPTSVENILESSFSDESNDLLTKIGPTTHATASKNTGLKGTRRKSCKNYQRLN